MTRSPLASTPTYPPLRKGAGGLPIAILTVAGGVARGSLAAVQHARSRLGNPEKARVYQFVSSALMRPMTERFAADIRHYIDVSAAARTQHRPRPPLVPAARFPGMPAAGLGWSATSARGSLRPSSAGRPWR